MDKDQAANDTLASNEAEDETAAAEVDLFAGQNSPSANAETIENDPQVDDDNDKSVSVQEEEEDEEGSKKSVLTVDDASQNSPKANNENNEGDDTPATKKKKKGMPPGSRRGRAPAVKGLTIPFRTVKKVRNIHVVSRSRIWSKLLS
jgi:hypothetical protein